MKAFFKKGQQKANNIWNGKYFLPFLLTLCILGLWADANIEFMFLFIAIEVLLLVFCDDIMSIVAPLFCIFLMAVKYYKDLSILVAYMWYGIVPFAVAAVFNIIYYRKPLVKGNYLWPFVAVSVSLIIGGAGVISSKEYFEPIALYYMLGLGVGMLLLYLLVRSRLENKRDYNRIERLAAIIYFSGILTAVVIAAFYISNFEKFLEKGTVLFFKARNFTTSVMLMALPMACLFVKRSNIHLIGMAFIYLAMIFSGSRSGLLFGTILLAMCLLYIYVSNKQSRRLYNIIIIAMLIPTVVLAYKYIPHLFSSRQIGEKLVNTDATRIKYFELAAANFINHPIFGMGVGNIKDIEVFKAYFPGCIMFYHNIVLQVISCLGSVGIAAFGWLFIKRVKELASAKRETAVVFGFSYLGILLMSMTNPGVFCPFPEAALLMVMFAVLEKEQRRD